MQFLILAERLKVELGHCYAFSFATIFILSTELCLATTQKFLKVVSPFPSLTSQTSPPQSQSLFSAYRLLFEIQKSISIQITLHSANLHEPIWAIFFVAKRRNRMRNSKSFRFDITSAFIPSRFCYSNQSHRKRRAENGEWKKKKRVEAPHVCCWGLLECVQE